MAVVRAMTSDDLDAVIHLEAATAEAPHWERSTYEGFLSESGPAKQTFIAEDCGKLVGFIAAQIILDVCELESIAVDPSARRTGIGKALLEALINCARQHHAAHIELEVRAGNSSAISFYTHNGFKRDGLRRGYYPNPEEDALLMSRALEPQASQ